MAGNGAALLICREYSEDKLTTKEKNKMRKPMVEKLRRDRINSSINQLRNLLEQDFQLLQPDSKPEKADILEIAVQFLKQQTCTNSNDSKSFKRKSQQQYAQGFAKCLHETFNFLSVHHIEEDTQLKVLNHFHRLESLPRDQSQAKSDRKPQPYQMKQAMLSNSNVPWRPW